MPFARSPLPRPLLVLRAALLLLPLVAAPVLAEKAGRSKPMEVLAGA